MKMRILKPAGRLRHGQRGFTLVEILIALGISMVMLAGLWQMFSNSRNAYKLQDAQSAMQEDARFLFALFKQEVSMAGYTTTGSGFTSSGVAVTAFNAAGGSAEGVGNAPDSIQISYESPTDCLGNSTALTNGIAVNTYSIDTTNNELQCVSTATVAAGGVADTLVSGVANMQILYGIDNTGDGAVNTYTNLAGVGTNKVVSVRLAFLLESVDSVYKIQDAVSFNLLDAPTLGPYVDTHIRRDYVTTVLTRN